MGTSSIFNGRTDKNALLPDDFDIEENTNIDQFEVVKWQTVKADFSKYINSGGRKGSVRHIAKQYVKAAGGTNKLVAQSTSGIRTGVNFGTFFNSIYENGVNITLYNFGIKYANLSVKEIFSRLIDAISPSANTKEDVVARKALVDALSEVYDYIEKNDLNVECLDHMPKDLMNTALRNYISSYIWITMMKDLDSRLEKYISNAQNAASVEREFKELIAGIVDVQFKSQGDIINKQVGVMIKDLYTKCLKVLEGII